MEGIDGLSCAPATIDLAGAEIELVSLVARETRLQRALSAYTELVTGSDRPRLDYVLIDCPPSLGLLTVNALVAAPEVLIPIQCEYYALEGVGQLLRNVELVKAHLNPDLHVSTILLTMYDARTRLAAQVADEVRTHFPETVLRTTIPRSVRISEAPSYGQTVMTYDPGSSGALSYLEAAREMALADCGRQSRQRDGGDAVSDKRRGLGRGLGALIPTAPGKGDGADGDRPVPGRRPASPAGPARTARRRDGPTEATRGTGRGGRRALRRDAAGLDHARTRGSRARSSTRRRWPSWSTRCARSACCSRSSSARSAASRAPSATS